jgi:hypothetical protein
VFNRLDENQRRGFVALESRRLGHGGDRLLSQITGIIVIRKALHAFSEP